MCGCFRWRPKKASSPSTASESEWATNKNHSFENPIDAFDNPVIGDSFVEHLGVSLSPELSESAFESEGTLAAFESEGAKPKQPQRRRRQQKQQKHVVAALQHSLSDDEGSGDPMSPSSQRRQNKKKKQNKKKRGKNGKQQQQGLAGQGSRAASVDISGNKSPPGDDPDPRRSGGSGSGSSRSPAS